MRVAIAGAGAVGRSVALELIDNGHEVLLIDKAPAVDPLRPRAGRPVAAGRRVRALVARGGPARDLRRRHRLHRRRQGQPRHLPAGQDRVLGAAHGRPRQPPEQRVAVQRVVGRRRVGVDAAPDVGARRGSRLGRRPRAAVHVPAEQHQPGRAHDAERLAVRRPPGQRRAVARRRRAGRDPAGQHHPDPRQRPFARGRRRAAVRHARGRRGPARASCSRRRRRPRTSRARARGACGCGSAARPWPRTTRSAAASPG